MHKMRTARVAFYEENGRRKKKPLMPPKPQRVTCCMIGPTKIQPTTMAGVLALLAYMDDDWLPEEPATAAAYKLLPEWVRWNGEQADVPGPLIERSVAVAERRQLDISDCPSFRFRSPPCAAP